MFHYLSLIRLLIFQTNEIESSIRTSIKMSLDVGWEKIDMLEKVIREKVVERVRYGLTGYVQCLG